MTYIVLDLEFNQAFNFKTGSSCANEPRLPFEIIQIGAVKLNENFETLDTFNYFIKPQVYKRLHPFVERLTKITNEKLNTSDNFTPVFKAFSDFLGEDEHILCTWGTDDVNSLFKNILFYNCNHLPVSKKYINVQSIASKYLKTQQGNSVGLKSAIELLNIEETMQYHDALNDALYTAKIFQTLKDQEFIVSDFNLNNLFKAKEGAKKTNTKALLKYFEKSLDRKLTTEEIAIIRTAYKFGKKGTFDEKK